MPPPIRIWCRGSDPLRRFGNNSGISFASPLQIRFQSTTVPSASKTIFSGIQPTGVPHLGNYLGALREWVRLQNESDSSTRLIFSLVDLHAITIRQEPRELRQCKKESLAALLAIGLDPSRSIIFHQSDVPAHAELMWILSCLASTGRLNRMTQWKDKTVKGENKERLRLGLYSYPVLQAADVLVHQTTHVPVGSDQEQHLELARELANAFNSLHADVLIPPETLTSPAKRIMALNNPFYKMSKSDPNPNSRILLTDSEDVIKAKLKDAQTDSLPGITYDPINRPGVSNLLDIMYHASHATATQSGYAPGTLIDLAKDLDGMHLRHVKEQAAAIVNGLIQPIREKFDKIVQDEELLQRTAAEGAERAKASAAKTMALVRDGVGLS